MAYDCMRLLMKSRGYCENGQYTIGEQKDSLRTAANVLTMLAELLAAGIRPHCTNSMILSLVAKGNPK